MTECYFGIACNYYDLGNLKKALFYFETYLLYDPEGEYEEQANDMLFYLDELTRAAEIVESNPERFI